MAVITKNDHKYVVVDEKDIGKTRIDLLIDLVYEATGTRYPQDKIKFGKPNELDQRPQDYYDPNTYLPVNVNIEYDRRFSAPVSGLMYRRLDIHEYMSKVNFEAIKPEFYPFRISDLLDQINEQLPYALDMSDLVEYEYASPEQWANGIHITPMPDSYVWTGKTFMVTVDTGGIGTGNLLEKHNLDGFNIYRPEGAPQPLHGFLVHKGGCLEPECPICKPVEGAVDVSKLDPRALPYWNAIHRPTNGAFKPGGVDDEEAPGSASYLNTPSSETDPLPISLPECRPGGGLPEDTTGAPEKIEYVTPLPGTSVCKDSEAPAPVQPKPGSAGCGCG